MKKYWYVPIFFVLFLFFSFYRHTESLSWDFSAYLLNAKFLFSDGLYYETYRPPLVPCTLGLGLLTGDAGQYFYISFVCILFFWSCLRLSQSLFGVRKGDQTLAKDDLPVMSFLFLFFILSNFVIFYAFRSGSELLSLALLQLFISSIIEGKISGHWFALAFLTRFNLLVFAPLLLINKSYKKIALNVGIAALLIAPYLFFNYWHYGNCFTGIVDSYALNIINRAYMAQPLSATPFWVVGGYFWVFVIIGVFAVIEILFNSHEQLLGENKRRIVLMSIITLMIVYSFKNTPIKMPRYLFNLSLPIAFFATLGLTSILKQQRQLRKPVFVLCLLWFAMTIASLAKDIHRDQDYDSPFKFAAKDITKLNLSSYYIQSPHWVILHRLAGNVYPLNSKDFSRIIEDGYIVLLFKRKAYQTADVKFTSKDLAGLPVIHETGNYIFLGRVDKNTKNKTVFDFPYTTGHNKIIAKPFAKVGLDGIVFKACEAISRDMSHWRTRQGD